MRIGAVMGSPRARPRAEGRKRDLSLPLAVPAKNSHRGSFLLCGYDSERVNILTIGRNSAMLVYIRRISVFPS